MKPFSADDCLCRIGQAFISMEYVTSGVIFPRWFVTVCAGPWGPSKTVDLEPFSSLSSTLAVE